MPLRTSISPEMSLWIGSALGDKATMNPLWCRWAEGETAKGSTFESATVGDTSSQMTSSLYCHKLLIFCT